MSPHKQEPITYSSSETVFDHGEKTVLSLQDSPPSATGPHPTHSNPAHAPEKVPSIIPAQKENDPSRPRTLILCFDGTENQFDSDNSNVVHFVSLLAKKDRNKQMVYYQTGLGTFSSPTFIGPISRTLDSMVAWNLDTHIKEGYKFLMQNYMKGDKVCIFGFSRGAYTARCLAGMIHKVGVLTRDNWWQVPFAYKMYTRRDDGGWKQSNQFKKTFSVDVKINFLGIWDTVSSVGFFIPRELPFSTSNTSVCYFRHAVSLDERRSKFRANLYNWPTQHERKLGTRLTNEEGEIMKPHKDHEHNSTSANSRSNADREPDDPEHEPDVEEVWFAGCHADVGGGSVKNGTPYSLCRIPLRWMVRECFKAKTGILFKSDLLHEIGLDLSTLHPEVKDRPKLPVDPTKYHLEMVDKGPSLIQYWLSQLKQKGPTPSEASCGDSVKVSMASREDKGSRDVVSKESSWDRIRRKVIPPKRAMPKKDPWVSEEVEDLRDALSPMYDQLKLKRHWWFLEILPVTFKHQHSRSEVWAKHMRWNLGRPRYLIRPHEDCKLSGGKSHGAVRVRVHRTVKIRMDAAPLEKKNGMVKRYFRKEKHRKGKCYFPKARVVTEAAPTEGEKRKENGCSLKNIILAGKREKWADFEPTWVD